MRLFASLGRQTGQWLGLTGSLPVAELPLPSPVKFISAPAAPAPIASAAPVAPTAPAWRRTPEQQAFLRAQRSATRDGNAEDQLAFGFASKFIAAKGLDAKRQVQMDFARFREAKFAGGARAYAPTNSDGVAQPNNGGTDNSVFDVIEDLQKTLAVLKDLAGDKNVSPDEEEAKSALAGGQRPKAQRALSRAISSFSAKITRARFMALTPQQKMSHAFSHQPAVRALAASLSPSKRASLALAPVGGGSTPTVNPTISTSAAPSPHSVAVAKVRSIQAELAALDKLQRREFTNERLAQHGHLKAKLHEAMKALRAQ